MKDIIDPRSAYERFTTQGGVIVYRNSEEIDRHAAVETLIDQLDRRRGVLLSSNYDYPGRYTRWDLGFSNPALEIASRDREIVVRALNARGRLLIGPVRHAAERSDVLDDLQGDDTTFKATLQKAVGRYPEEHRSKQPSVFSVLRSIIDVFRSRDDIHLGLYGAFGYDLAFQFEPVQGAASSSIGPARPGALPSR